MPEIMNEGTNARAHIQRVAHTYTHVVAHTHARTHSLTRTVTQYAYTQTKQTFHNLSVRR